MFAYQSQSIEQNNHYNYLFYYLLFLIFFFYFTMYICEIMTDIDEV